MTETKFQPGTLVRDNRGKVGKVAGSPGSVTVDGVDEQQFTVDFWGEKERRLERWLTPLDADSPEAMLWDHPEQLASWVEEKPLQLVALALSVMGGKGKSANIKRTLDAVPGCKSSAWWSPTQAKLKMPELKEYFGISKSEITLKFTKSAISEIPSDANLSAFLQSEWRSWLLNDPIKPVVWSEWPNKESFDALDKVLGGLKGGDSEQSLSNTLQAAQLFLESNRKKTSAIALNWLETLSRVHLRWDDNSGSHDGVAIRTGELLLSLCELAGYDKSGRWLLQAYSLIGMPEEWRQGFVAGMWTASAGPAVNAASRRRLFNSASSLMGRQRRADLAREIALAAFRAGNATRSYPEPDELDRILQDLASGEESQRILELIALSSDASAADKSKLLDYVLNSRHARGPERLNLLVLATLLLTDGTGSFAAQASRELATAFASPGDNGYDVQTVFKDIRECNDQLRESIANKVKDLRRDQAEELEPLQERWRLQVWDLGAEVDALEKKLRQMEIT